MDAFILHADGDEGYAQDLRVRLAPAKALEAPLSVAGGLAFGEHLLVLAIWSAQAEAAGLARQLADVARHVGDRCIIVRADGTPLPALSSNVQIAVLGATDNSFAAMLKIARMRARPAAPPARVRSGFQIGGVAPGVGVGLAIYAGMFVAAGAWRSDDVTQALEANREAPATVALRSFQTALDAPETAHVRVASAEPNARFVQPQRVIVTASMDSTRLPVAVAPTPDAPEPLVPVAAAPAAPAAKPVSPVAVSRVPLSPIPSLPETGAASLTLIALDGISTLDVVPNESF
ncbi:MAG: hypothetical protein JNM47_09920 [Hyphomonadaceae bacterium]|nr:hypothetical protein [Hyphomonadaceae bacterium]